MKKLLLGIFTLFVLGTMTIYGQTINGPGLFPTYTEDFEDGTANNWVPTTAGSYEVGVNDKIATGGKWYNQVGPESFRNSILSDQTFENYTYSATIYPVWGNPVGLIFNYQDENNYYYIHMVPGAHFVFLGQVVDGEWNMGGGFDQLWNAPGRAMFNDPVFKERSDSTFNMAWFENGDKTIDMKIKNGDGKTSVWLDGQLIFDNIVTEEFTKGKIGTFTFWNPARFDNIKVESNATVSGGTTVNGPGIFNAYTEDFEDGTANNWTPTTAGSYEVGVNDKVATGGKWYNQVGPEAFRNSILSDQSFENFTLSSTIYPVWGNPVGLIFNYQDDNNYYYIHMVPGAHFVFLGQVVDGEWNMGGGFDQLWNAPGRAMFKDPVFGERSDSTFNMAWFENGDKTIDLKIKNGDGKTSVWFDGQLLFDNILTEEFTKGKIGTFTFWNPARFDNIKVESNALLNDVVRVNDTKFDVNVYPNPVTNGNFTVHISNCKANSRIDIYDMTGKLVYNQSQINSSEVKLNLGNISAKGIYLVKVNSGNQVSSNKILIQ